MESEIRSSHSAPAAPTGRIEITLVLRPKTPIPELHHGPATISAQPDHLAHSQFRERHAAHPDDIAVIRNFAQHHKLQVTDVDGFRRTARISGTAESIDALFGTTLHQHHAADGSSFLAPAGSSSIPPALHTIVEAVLGINTAHVGRRHKIPFRSPVHKLLSPRDLANAYAFPKGMDGRGRTIGLIELGGGFHSEDIERFCEKNGLPTPSISVVEVHGGANRPAHHRAIHEMLDCVDGQLHLSAAALESDTIASAQATVEVTMDLEIVAALAPAANLIVYFATPDEQGIYHALSRAVHDIHHLPDVLSISWGEAETALSGTYLNAIDRLLEIACHLGITVCASAGDAGALNHSPDHLPAVNFPASSPHCLACGGTTPHFRDEPADVQVAEEIVWNATHFGFKGATGGGVSRTFPVPAWQQAAGIPLGPTGHPGRGVPDVAGPADPRYGCEIQIAGRTFSSAGTSAVAPLWAALIACCNQALGARCGHLNPHIYHIGHHRLAGLRPVTQGDNGAYKAGPGWNACTGYGTPSGVHLLHHLQQVAGAKRPPT